MISVGRYNSRMGRVITRMEAKPKIVLGMTIYNKAQFIGEALDSILSQSYSEFKIVALDDASTDATASIMAKYVEQDSRITYIRNPTNIGQIANFRKAFQCAQQIEPSIDYFAWVTDHDVWAAEWVEELLKCLEADPEAVLAYPETHAISGSGKTIPVKFPRFETKGMSKAKRIRASGLKIKGMGNMIFGLYRADALANTSVYPHCSRPDGALFLQLSVLGSFIFVDKPLWHRRYADYDPSGTGHGLSYEATLDRQRSFLFYGKTPWYAHFPILSHVVILIYTVSIKPTTGNYANIFWGVYLACLYSFRRRHSAKKEIQIASKKLLLKTKVNVLMRKIFPPRSS